MPVEQFGCVGLLHADVADRDEDSRALSKIQLKPSPWEFDDAQKAEKLIRNLARRLEQDRPGVAASILEGLDEILTVVRLKLPIELRRSLSCIAFAENTMGTIRRVAVNLKRWRNGKMALRRFAAGMIEAAKSFACSKAHKQLPILRAALLDRQQRLAEKPVAPVSKAVKSPTPATPLDKVQQTSGHPPARRPGLPGHREDAPAEAGKRGWQISEESRRIQRAARPVPARRMRRHRRHARHQDRRRPDGRLRSADLGLPAELGPARGALRQVRP